MAEIKYTCNLCGISITKLIFKNEDLVGYMSCQNEYFDGPESEKNNPEFDHLWKTCGGVLERVLRGPSVTVVEARDNGAMPRRVEQQKDIAEILKERSRKDKESK